MDTDISTTCPVHAVPMEQKISQKTNRPYWSHMVDGAICFGKGVQPSNGFTPRTPSAPRPAPARTEPDWDAIAEGKVRHGIVVAFIQSAGLVKLEPETVETINEWVKYVMSGEYPL